MDPAEHADSRGMIESVLRYIPGFRGYLEKEYRRESDHLARAWLADRIHQCKRPLDEYQRSLVEAVQIDELPRCERVRSRLDKIGSKIRGAVRGYSGFFDFVQVDEMLLDEVYRHDMSLVSDVEALTDRMDSIGSTSDPPAKVTGDLLQILEDLERKFDERGALLQGIGSKP